MGRSAKPCVVVRASRRGAGSKRSVGFCLGFRLGRACAAHTSGVLLNPLPTPLQASAGRAARAATGGRWWRARSPRCRWVLGEGRRRVLRWLRVRYVGRHHRRC